MHFKTLCIFLITTVPFALAGEPFTKLKSAFTKKKGAPAKLHFKRLSSDDNGAIPNIWRNIPPTPLKKLSHAKTLSEVKDDAELKQLANQSWLLVPIKGESQDAAFIDSFKNKVFCVKCKMVVDDNLHNCLSQ